MLKLGTQKISALYLGGEKIVRGLVGMDVVFELGTPVVAYTISAALDLPDGGIVTGGGTYQAGENVTLTASAKSGYLFNGWREDGREVSRDASYTFTVDRSRDLTAMFAKRCMVTFAADPAGAGTVPSSHDGLYGGGVTDILSVIATPASGYEFVAWKEDGNVISTDPSMNYLVTKDVQLVAVFAAASRLPAGYTELAYLEVPGSSRYGAAISTSNITLTSSTVIEVDFEYNGARTGYLLYHNVSNLTSLLIGDTSGTKVSAAIRKNASFSNSFESFLNRKTTFRIDVGQNTISVGGVSEKISGAGTSNTTGLLYIGAGNTTTYKAPGKYYEMRLYSGSTLLYQLVPAQNSSGAIGFYDIKKSKFIEVPTTGNYAWTAGPAV